MKQVSIFLVCSVLFLLTLSFVYAAGSSTLDDSSDESASDDTSETQATSDACDEMNERRERIICRLRESKEARLAGATTVRERYAAATRDYQNDVLPEACRGLGAATGATITNRTQCRALYQDLRACYSMSGQEKPRCFKEKAGLTGNRMSEEAPARVRQYVVALLYDIEERVEYANTEGSVSDEDAAAIIDLITEIKEDIMNGAGRDVVRQKLAELRTLLRTTAQASGDDTTDAEESG